MSRKQYLISLLIVLISFYGGMRYERYFLTKNFVRVANQVIAIYENNIAALKQQMMHERYPNSGADNEKYKL